MFKLRIGTFIRTLLFLLVAGAISEYSASDAYARVGNRRSIGRSTPSYQPQRSNNPGPSAQPAPPPGGRGGFMKGLAGGLAGGVLGSMLFSSMGHAAGLGGGAGGGIGLIEILLLAGLAYVAFRWWKNRQMQTAGAGGPSNFMRQDQTRYDSQERLSSSNLEQGAFARSFDAGPVLSKDEASDVFFQVQGAWTRRNLASVRDKLSDEVAATLESDLAELRQLKRINRLENISVRQVDILENWRELDTDYARVRFTANLLDYTIDEASSQVLEGSDSQPVKFEEDWIFARTSARAAWRVSGLQQVVN